MEFVPTKKWEMQASVVVYLLNQSRLAGILKSGAWVINLLACKCHLTWPSVWYVNKISGTNDLGPTVQRPISA